MDTARGVDSARYVASSCLECIIFVFRDTRDDIPTKLSHTPCWGSTYPLQRIDSIRDLPPLLFLTPSLCSIQLISDLPYHLLAKLNPPVIFFHQPNLSHLYNQPLIISSTHFHNILTSPLPHNSITLPPPQLNHLHTPPFLTIISIPNHRLHLHRLLPLPITFLLRKTTATATARSIPPFNNGYNGHRCMQLGAGAAVSEPRC